MTRPNHRWLPVLPVILFLGLLATASSHPNQTVSGDLTAEEWRLLHDSFSRRVINAVKQQDRGLLKQIFKEAGTKDVFPEWLLEYNQNILQSCQKDAILFTGNDLDTTAAWYLQQKGTRKDVSVIPLGLLGHDWFRFALVGPNHFIPTNALDCPYNIFSDSTKFGSDCLPQNEMIDTIQLITRDGFRPVHFSINCNQDVLGLFQNQLVHCGMTWLQAISSLESDPPDDRNIKMIEDIFSGEKGFRSIRHTVMDPPISIPQSIRFQYIDIAHQFIRHLSENKRNRKAAKIKNELIHGIGKNMIFQPDFH